MSLLMEALKKAEEAKRQAGEGASPSAAATELATQIADRASGSPAGSPLPNLSQHLDAVDADLAAVSATPSPVRRAPPALGDAEERSAARNVFAAKRTPKTGNALWLIVSVGALAILSVGGYFWWQLQAIQPPAIGRPATPLNAAPALAQTPVADVSNLVRPAPVPLSPAPSPETPASTVSAAATPLPPHPTKAANQATAAVRPEQRGEQRQDVRDPAADATVRLSRTPPRPNTALERAYESLQAGRTDEAQRGYEQALRADGKNTDALLGLATLAAQAGQIEKAHAYYLRALETDPSDPTAKAGVLSTRGQADADGAESRLKTALAGQPDSPSLLFALGNLYARQGRWSEAQQTYFQAYAAEPDNPDIIFNLAISLDHLRQGKLAAQYYQMALNAGESRKTSFDRSQVRNRLLELQP